MRIPLAICYLLSAICSFGADVLWQSETFTGTPLSNRLVYITPIANYSVSGSRIISGDRQRYTNDATGSLIVSNLTVARSYRVEFIGPYITTIITNSFPANVTGYVNAADFVAGQVSDGNFVGYSQATADSRFHKTSAGSSTNATFRGTVKIPEGATVGYVFTVTNADGSGAWQPAASGVDAGLTNQWRADAAATTNQLKADIGSGSVPVAASALTGTIDDARLPATITSDITGTAAQATIANGLSATMTNFLYYIQTNNLPVFDVTRFGAYPGKPSNTTNIQAAIEAAGAVATDARPAVVYIPRGDYPCDPYETVFGSGRTSEAHQSVLTIWTNNVWIVGDGKNATKLRATRDGPSGVMNFIGAGSSVAASDAYTRYTSNIILAGIEIDADGYEFECTQIFNPVNWLAIDCRTRGAAWRSGNSFDGWDTQGEIGFTFIDCEAVDCSGNGFGVSSGTSTNVFLFNIRAERCGTTTAANGGALQFVQNPPPKVRGLIAKSCGTLVTPGSYFDIEDAIIVVTNKTAKTNIYLGSPFGGTLRNVRFEAVPNTAAPLIAVAGGYVTLENVKADNVTWRAVHMTSGSAIVKDGSVLGATGAQTPLEASGGTLTVENSTLYANTSARDIILTSGGTAALIVRNCKFGGTGIAANVGGFLIENSVFNYGTIFANGAGVIRGNSFLGGGNAFNISGGTNYVSNNYFGPSTSITIAGGTPWFQNNYFATSTYSRSGGSPTFLGGNIFSANALAMSVTLGAFRPGINSVTPTASQTLFTNTTYFPLRLHWYGGTLTGYGLNGTQLGTGAGSVMVTPGDWVGITNTDTTGHVIRWSVY